MSFMNMLKQTIRRWGTVFLAASLLLTLLVFPVVSAEENYDLPWLWPVPGSYRINSLDYYNDGGVHSQGQCIDIDANGYTGTDRLDVISATSGTVYYIQNTYDESTNKGSGWGNYVIVRSGNIYIVYAHLKEVTCDYGRINAGDVIGKMGNTGNSTGVHLHMQAYPVGGDASSNEIRVFDKYKDNPLYATRFRFWKGLQNTSVRYGEWISTYFQALNGVYYVYSGGLDLSYTVVPLSAVVTVVRTSGAKVYTHPSAENQYEVGHLLRNETVAISAYYQDAFGDLWLLLSDTEGERWISSNDVGFKEYTYQTILERDQSPTGTYGGLVDIVAGGRLVSANTISSLSVRILKEGEEVASGKASVNESVYEYSYFLDSLLSVDSLSDGEYVFELLVTETATYPGAEPQSKTYLLTTSEFCIDSSIADKTPPFLDPIEVRSLSAQSIELFCVVADNNHINKVLAKFEKGSFSKEFAFEMTEGGYRLSVPTSALSGPGEYTLLVTAYDVYGNFDQRSVTITLPAYSSGETWKVSASTTPNLRVRSAPSLSAAQVGKLYPGNYMTITEIVEANGYLWGKCELGWCALRTLNGTEILCEYVSGALCSLQYHLNGGIGEQPLQQSFYYGQSFTVSTLSPTKNGYTFLGWAESSAAKTPTYQIGSSYKATGTITLFAVWSDNELPVIDSVELSHDDWTSGPVILTVNASDNTGEIYYSFDGGLTWQHSSSYEVWENKTIEKGSIVVRDPYGNRATYSDSVVIDLVDAVPPDVSSGTISLVPQEGGASVSFTGFVDSMSGINSYEIHLTKSGKTEFSLHKFNSSGVLSLADGVYSGFVRVIDNVGNFSDVPFSRFLVGDSISLLTPSNVTVLETSSTFVSLSWDSVKDADCYRIEISLSEDFSNPICATSYKTEFTFSSLTSGKTYYLRIFALCEDGLFLTSEPTPSISFITRSSDKGLYGFSSLTDVMIDSENATASVVVPYHAQALNLTAVPAEGASVRYFADAALQTELLGEQISAYSFSGDTAIVYLLVTAENGDTRTYSLTVVRASQSAALPNVDHMPLNQSILMGQEGNLLYVTATSPDSGTITVSWYAVGSDGVPVMVSNDWKYCPVFSSSGTYAVYAVITNTNPKCETTTSTLTTPISTITVHKFSSVIEAVCPDYEYNGAAPVVSYRKYLGDGTISYRFFADSKGEQEISPPINAGIYYVQAIATETDCYYASESELQRFEIRKLPNPLMPSYTVTQPTLRDRKGYVEVNNSDVEYRINGADWLPYHEKLTLRIGDVIELRYMASTNVEAGTILPVTILPFDGTEDIVPAVGASMMVSGNYLFIDQHSMTSAEFLLALTKSENVYLYDAGGSRLNGTDRYLVTGGKVTVEDEEGEYVAYTIVINGDVNGDGVVDRTDVSRILRISNGMEILDGAFDLLAGDLNGDGILTSADAYLANTKI